MGWSVVVPSPGMRVVVVCHAFGSAESGAVEEADDRRPGVVAAVVNAVSHDVGVDG